jgi:hypothetical protein
MASTQQGGCSDGAGGDLESFERGGVVAAGAGTQGGPGARPDQGDHERIVKEETALEPALALRESGAGASEEALGRHDLVDESLDAGGGGFEKLAGEDEVECGRQAEEGGESR